uniref:Nuclear transcription factor Y subunit n=1 Tax=Steinernema glaseri TaxID=37863 RepID=A0A1I7YNG1_9BILA
MSVVVISPMPEEFRRHTRIGGALSLSHGGQHQYVQHHRSPPCSAPSAQQQHIVTSSAQCITQSQYPSMRFVPVSNGDETKSTYVIIPDGTAIQQKATEQAIHVAPQDAFRDTVSSCDSVSTDGSRRSPDLYPPSGSKIVDYQNVCQVIPQEGAQPIIIQLVPSAPSSSAVVSQPATEQIPVQAAPKEEEPLYVNAKQYNRILKRRLTRAKLEQQGLIPKERRKYLHESRHKHALKRQRGEGGKFDSAGSFSEDAGSPKENCLKSPEAITEQVRTVFQRTSCDEDSHDSLQSVSV